jgi:hypothetical protein
VEARIKKLALCLFSLAILLCCGVLDKAISSPYPISLSVTPYLLGTGWEQTETGFFIPTYHIVETEPHLVTVGLSDGNTEVFSFAPYPNTQLLVPIQFLDGAIFTPEPDTRGSLTAPEQPFIVLGSIPGPVELLNDIFEIYDPRFYRYTLDSEQFILEKGFSVPTPCTILLLASALTCLAGLSRKRLKLL